MDELILAERELAARGARRHRDEAARELRRLGRRVVPSGSSPRRGASGALSTREHEVAELVVEGRTNAQIADELFVSAKKVETHVRNICGKLGVRRRTDVVRELERSRSAATPL